MSSPSFTRIGTASQYDSAVRNISARQTALSNLQENLTSGKRVVRASDDPVAAAQAERALTRMGRNTTDVRALDMQRNTMVLADSALGSASDALQNFRELLVNAGNGTHTQTERDAIAQQLVGLREQILNYANRQDPNGLPLFQALGSAQTPLTGPAPQYGFAGLGGQAASGNTQIASVLDGEAAWMRVPTGNGVFTITREASNTGKAWADVGQVTNPSVITGGTYSIEFFQETDGTTTFEITPAPDPLNTTLTADPTYGRYVYTAPMDVAFDGMKVQLSGAPEANDTFTVAPSTHTSVFQVLDNAISALRNGSNADGSTSGAVAHGIAQGLNEIDSAMNRLQASRGLAGDLLNRADRIEGELDTRSIQLEADRSRAEDLDMIQGISDFQNQQVGYQAALQSYAMVQKLSLFNYLS